MFYIKIFLTVVFAVTLTLFGYEWFNKNRTQKYISAAHISEGIAASSSVKLHITEYYQMNGSFPSSNQEIDLPPSEKFTGQSLIRLQVSDGGIITLNYDEKSGVKNGIIKLIPSIDSVTGIKWKCITPSFKNISLSIPTCEYVK